jgi:hypothetical protein
MRITASRIRFAAAAVTLFSATAFTSPGRAPSRGCTSEEIDALWTMQYAYCSTNNHECAYVDDCCIDDMGFPQYASDCGDEPCDEYFYVGTGNPC